MLTCLNSSLLEEAFQAVYDNHGCAGVDGVTVEKFKGRLGSNLKLLEEEVKNRKYFPLPLMKIVVDKGNGEGRNLCVPAVRDHVLQKALLTHWEPILEKEFEESSFGYRKGRSVKQAVLKVKEYYSEGYRWVVDADIDAFFDSVDHSLLLEAVKGYIDDFETIDLIELWIKAEIWDGKNLKIPSLGLPQGSPISPILANLFLDKLDEEMESRDRKYVRYADEFLVLCKSASKAKKALELTNEILAEMLLKLDEGEVTSFESGFHYLGVTFVGSMAFVPFDKPKKERRILSFPEPFNLNAYLLKKKRGW